jgi:Rps23 Pro-64 3,4-dihydroxylase Tpa1-like proline 4-hydroxylase
MSIDEAKKHLKEKGYCSFDLKDFDESLFKYIEKYKSSTELSRKENYTSLRADFTGDYWTKIYGNINTDMGSFEAANNKKEKILAEIKNTNKDMFQIWLFHNVSDNNLKKVYDKITKHFFDLDDSEELSIELSSTLYNDRCFLHDHIDGKSPVKNYASILIYLNENWNQEDGGNLILRGDDKIDYKVVPEFGRVAMIDLQNFDIYHAVEKVINNKERCCLIAFPFNKKNKQD